MLIEVAADQLMAFAKTLESPPQSIDPWTCTRAILESAALAGWLLDPSINARTRIERSLAFRYDGFSEEIKFLRAIGNESSAARVIMKIEKLERLASELGFLPLRNTKGERIGIGQRMNSVTDIVKSVLNEEAFYRLCSAVINGQIGALQGLSFRRLDTTTFTDLILQRKVTGEPPFR